MKVEIINDSNRRPVPGEVVEYLNKYYLVITSNKCGSLSIANGPTTCNLIVAVSIETGEMFNIYMSDLKICGNIEFIRTKKTI